MLDKRKTFSYVDTKENRWYLKYGQHYQTTEIAWWAFYSEPGSKIMIPMGKISDREAESRMEKHTTHPIDSDVIVDIGVWLARGGLEEFFSTPHPEVAKPKVKREG